jgi:DNA-binding transcriptional ArsR family regulator
VTTDLAEEIKALRKRIAELEAMLATVVQPLQKVNTTMQNYLRLTGLLLDHGGLTPEVILPEVKDPIAKDIIRALLERSDQNISQITELVRSRRGTASRRIIREKLKDLGERNIIEQDQTGSRQVYRLSPTVIKKWSQLLGFSI